MLKTIFVSWICWVTRLLDKKKLSMPIISENDKNSQKIENNF